MPLSALQTLVIPLLYTTITSSDSAGSSTLGGHGVKRGAADKAQNVVEHAIDTVRAVAAQLPWHGWLNLLFRFLKVCKPGDSGGVARGRGERDLRHCLQNAGGCMLAADLPSSALLHASH